MRHHIIVKWNEEVQDKVAIIDEVKAVFAPCTEIPGIHKVELIPNVVDRPNRYDLMIVISMEREALETYDGCSAHKLWKANYGKFIQSKAIFDSEEL